VFQLRLRARGNTAHSGLAGRSPVCKRGFGLALPRADGEHHCSRGGVASNRARGTGCHTPRRNPKSARMRRLDQGCYRGKRERERERDVSALLTHLPTGTPRCPTALITPVPNELMRKNNPSSCDPAPLPYSHSPAKKRLPSIQRTDPNPIYRRPAPTLDAMTPKNIQSTIWFVKSEPHPNPTTHRQRATTKPGPTVTIRSGGERASLPGSAGPWGRTPA
jgi:hypothetical protein